MKLGDEWSDAIEAVHPNTYEQPEDRSAWDRILARRGGEVSHAKTIPMGPAAEPNQTLTITAKRLVKNPLSPALVLWGAFAALMIINMLNERGSK